MDYALFVYLTNSLLYISNKPFQPNALLVFIKTNNTGKLKNYLHVLLLFSII
jgi:hypothetical protein